MTNIKFLIKQVVKMAMQQIYMPMCYGKYVRKNPNIEKGLVLFADSHSHTGKMPFSMACMYEQVCRLPDYHVQTFITDFNQLGKKALLQWIDGFMEAYAKAEYVFICDNFLPVASCKKRKETKVVQLWHSGGLLKKSGYDTKEDIPSHYKGNVYKNYDYLTVSAPCCVPVFQKIMQLPGGVVHPTGISRTDAYFDKHFSDENQKRFYQAYPQAAGKKVVLWAPTFRGNAGMPTLYGMDSIKQLMEQTQDTYFWVIKLHPHLEGKNGLQSNCHMPTEQLFAVADLLITDYSSVLFDYMAYEKPFVFFAPDLKEYEEKRGFYVAYDSFPTTIAQTKEELQRAIEWELSNRSSREIKECYDYYMAGCDGHATERILNLIGMK